MGNVTCDVAVSVDGYSSRPDQTLEHPFGAGVDLHRWMVETADENAAEIAAIVDAGAFVMGRNMFTPGRGEWDPDWQGWWGPEPPYHAPVFVLTHHPREPLVLEGGTTFFFVTDGVESAVAQAREAAGDRDVAIVDAGAFVMGRNMFTPGRGEWDPDWQGWWGPEPPYHAPVFVLTHHPREPLVLEGGTTFFFVTDGVGSAVAQAREAAGDRDVAIAGGAATINQVITAGLLDELRLHVVPQVLGHGDRVLDGVPPLALETVAVRAASRVTHVTYRVRGPLG